FVPGNHDVSRYLCRQVALEQDEYGFDDDELRRRLDEVKLRRYEGFLKSFYGTENLDEIALPLGRGAYLYNFSNLRLTVAALNSCKLRWRAAQRNRSYARPRRPC
ncbi:MAG: hypothetical protein GY856_16050, partial [bacterium]|nr:hypothetical protein [bacterium]